MSREQFDSGNASLQDRLGPLNPEKDYRGLKIIQTQALNVFSHFATDRDLGRVIQRYVGPECYTRNQGLLNSHTDRLNLAFDSWNGTDRDDLFYALLYVDKAEVAADPSDTFLTGSALGQELFAHGQLDQVVGFSTVNYQDFQRDVTNYLIQQLCRIYFINPDVRLGAAAKKRLAEDEAREAARQRLAQGRLTRGLLPYSEEDTETLVRLWIEGVPMKEIAQEIGRTPSSVAFQVAKLEDLPSRGNLRKWTGEEVADVIRLRTERHLTFAQIGEILFRSERSVQHKLNEKGVISFHRKLWEEDEVKKLAELLVSEYSWTTVLQKLSSDYPKGRTVEELRKKAFYSDLRIKTEFQIKRAQLEQLLSEGLSDKVIADRLGVVRSSVDRWKKRLQVEKER